ncbi:hypothetical protein G6F46_000835 [Rhizopus delemar]|uniref:Uncharacterized protein n=1 Tax=Rhizopus delemar (strain RA 99-880 / ATCC MYA-4621 / FGSC 9543 / NRRL 43880) TaxID=246409 RepID=I1CPZ0_RHIO9|nr:hypothetical protein RO3G_15231 [Rhizopus delemar RA 99-880]KAG1505040.1 hypothetical protein G6F54_000581 [Rhizopus delemar]KAG1515018.1 hypothetical protein G6F53_003241 [Rhizopus delemar]KAG1557945.1 hypothetical protein G6F49_004938 [Rhizopus delemar]KAG1594718.1 hypothetical protein G6F48_001181 [Rhizopus delemar]|eukprot:EIE90520.1 hypothetical protein RO3G_15231 [Rhizopus delemar RA 99-880]
MQKLPLHALKDISKIGETELFSTCFDPILPELIAIIERHTILRWSNKKQDENNDFRPDTTITKIHQLEVRLSFESWDVKAKSSVCDYHALCHDVLRLGILAKDSVDHNKLECALAFQIHERCEPKETECKRWNMLIKVESAPFEGGKLRHSTSDQLLINKKNTVNRKSLVGMLDNGKHTAAESPEISVVNKRKPLKRLEDGACIYLSESEMWTKEIENIYPYSPFLSTVHEEVLIGDAIDRLSGETSSYQKSDHLEVGIAAIANDSRNRCVRDNRNGLGL